MRVLNNTVTIITGLISVFAFITALTNGESLVNATLLSCGVFLGLLCVLYASIITAIAVAVFTLYVLSRIVVLLVIGALFGVLGGLFNIFGS